MVQKQVSTSAVAKFEEQKAILDLARHIRNYIGKKKLQGHKAQCVGRRDQGGRF